VDYEIKELDCVLDEFEKPEFSSAVNIAPTLPFAVSLIREHYLWGQAARLLTKEKGLSPVLLDRLKRYILVKPALPNVDHPRDAAALTNLMLLHEVYGVDSPEFRAGVVIAKNLSSPWWSWQWVMATVRL
jgi:hypothetical protein